jgi:Raf kinase inhibitor-like YbhB/YbcL family protein
VKRIVVFLIVIILLALFFFTNTHSSPQNNLSTQINPSVTIRKVTKHAMTITSSAFKDKQTLPMTYSCDGEKISPPLEFNEVPINAKSLVLIMEDPDVPRTLKPDGMWDHWVVFNIPSSTTSIESGQTPPGLVGQSTSGNTAYDPACPPSGEHRYFFKLYALDSMLMFDDPAKVTKQMVEDEMEDHIIDQAELVGLYERKH